MNCIILDQKSKINPSSLKLTVSGYFITATGKDLRHVRSKTLQLTSTFDDYDIEKGPGFSPTGLQLST